MDRQTRRLLRYRPPPAVVVVAVVIVLVGLSAVSGGHWQLVAPFAILALPWYLVWRHHRVEEARRLGLLPPLDGPSVETDEADRPGQPDGGDG